MFLDEIPAYSGWSIALLDALHDTGINDIALKLHPGKNSSAVVGCSANTFFVLRNMITLKLANIW